MFPNEQAQDNFFNSIGLISLLVGVQNLQENRQQTAANDVHSANDEQAKLLLTEIRKLFEEQNKTLEKLMLLKGLKGMKNFIEVDSVNKDYTLINIADISRVYKNDGDDETTTIELKNCEDSKIEVYDSFKTVCARIENAAERNA